MRIVTSALVVVALLLSGCAATVKKTSADATPMVIPKESAKKIVMNVTGSSVAVESKDWEPLKGAWRAAMKSASQSGGAEFEAQDGEPRPKSEAGTLIVVYVNDYRYLSAGVRYGFGIMTGNAFMDAKIEFLDLMNGARFGVRSYNTSSSAWEGVFSAMTEKQLDAICKEVVAEINPH